jgi:hypothetical protein
MKKGIFMVSILLLSLILVQIVVMKNAFEPNEGQTNIRPIEMEMRPVHYQQKDQFFILDEHVIILKDGKYYVMDRKKAA